MLESPPAWGPPEPLTISPHVVAHTLAYNAHAVCKSSAHRQTVPGTQPATFQERNQIAGMVGEHWMAGWFQHVCSFPDHQSHSPFGSGCTGDANHAIEGNPASCQLHPRRNYEEKPMISCHALSNSTNRLGIVALSQRIKHAFSLVF